MVEVARRSLQASLDGDPFVSPSEDGRFRLAVESTPESTHLSVEIDARHAVLRLAPITGHRWRSGWLLEIDRGGVLSVDQQEIAIDKPRRLVIRPRLQQRVLSRELAGVTEQVPMTEVACHRYTRQSTVASAIRAASDLAPWAEPTEPERTPWWELDLGHAMYVAWLRLDLLAPPPDATIAIRAYAHVQPDGSPPATSVLVELTANEIAAHDGQLALALEPDVVARYIRIELRAASPVTLAMTATEILAAELTAPTFESTLRRSFTLFRDRPLICTLEGEPVATYEQIWSRAMALARGIAARVEPVRGGEGPLRDRGVLAILIRSRPEWLIADLAGLVRGYVSVPISPDEPDDRLAHVLARAPATVIACEAADAERLRRLSPTALLVVVGGSLEQIEAEGATATAPPPAERAPSDLYAVLFTSGSTGAPKGAMRTYATFFAMIASYQVGHSPRHLSFQPLSHLSERMYLPALIIHGGTLAFSRGGAHLLDDLKTFGPTTLGSVPRLFEVLHASFRRRLRALIAAEPTTSRGVLEARALAEARAAFGPNLGAISIGSAPVSAEVFAFLKRAFPDIWVTEGYGSTEVGTIATDGKISDTAQVKLVPLPDGHDNPNRGEIWVKSPHAISGYLGDPDATKAAFDADGYFATGDLGERDAEGRIKVVGRLRNTVKLAQGEFVSAERIETALANCPLVDRIFVHAVAGAVGVSALVVPHADALARALGRSSSSAGMSLSELCAEPNATSTVSSALRAYARTAGLAPYETPRGVLLEPAPFTVESGLITGNGKLARGTLAKRYGDRLAALVASAPIDVDSQPEIAVEDDEDELDLRARVVRVASAAIGRSLEIDEPLAGAGVDSLASAEILAALSDELGRDVPLSWWFEARTLGDLAVRLAHFATVATQTSLRDQALADLALPPIHRQPASSDRQAANSAAAPTMPRHVLLSGATGFLGGHLVEALLERGIAVTCLVRARNTEVAHVKLAAALAAREIPVTIDRVRIIAGDLAAPQLGLDAVTLAAFDRAGAIASTPIDTVIHCGATVSWLASYDSLRAPNVLGTRALLELAAERGWAFHYVSTISTVPADGDEDSSLTFDAALAGTPYGLSKWIAEQHVVKSDLGASVYRPAMIAGHTQRGIGNPDDFLCRYLSGCIELGIYIDRADAILDMTPVDYVAKAIAGLLDRPGSYNIANVGKSLSFAGVGRAIAAAGYAARPASYEEFRSALGRSKGRLHALAAFFPEQFNLGMGPWPSTRTFAALAERAIEPPQIDDAYIARCLSALARHDSPR